MNYWLLKTETSGFSIDDLERVKVEPWTGVRNYQARNFMAKDMKVGDLCLFYHSSANPTGVYGIAKVASKPHADETQFNKKSHYFEPRATREKPVWFCVDVAFVKKLKNPVSLAEIKNDPNLSGMMVRVQGSRLSIQPVSEKHFKYIIEELANS